MQRIWSLLVFLCFLCPNLQAQFPQFHKAITDSSVSAFSSYAFAFDSNIIVQTTQNVQSNTAIREKLFLLDKQGNINKQKNLYPQETTYRMDAFGYSKGIVALKDTVLYMAEGLVHNGNNVSDKSILYKLDSNLNVQWCKAFPETFTVTSNSVTMAGSNILHTRIIIIDTTYPSGSAIHHNEPVVYKFSPDGTLLSGQRYTSAYSAGSISAYTLKNSNIALFTGCQTKLPAFLPDTVFFGCILVLDTNGNVKLSKRYNTFYPERLLETKSGNFLITGAVIVDSLKTFHYSYGLFDTNFNPIWIKAIDHNNWAPFNGIAEDASGHFILGSEFLENYRGYPLIIKTDQNGNLLDNYLYNETMIPYHHFSKDIFGRYIWTSTDTAFHLLISATDTIGQLNGCKHIQPCGIKIHNWSTYVMPYTWYVNPINNVQNYTLFTEFSGNVTVDYCNTPPPLDASFTLAKDTVCTGETFSLLSAAGVTEGLSEWIIRDSLTGYYAQLNVANTQLNQPGVYPITHIHHLFGCTDTATQILVVRTSLSAANDTLAFCDTVGSIKTISALPGSAYYVWNTGATTASIPITQGGVYSYAADYGCGADTGFILTLFEYPNQLNLRNDTTVCADKTPLTIGIDSGYTSYLWNTGATSGLIAVSDSGLYILHAFNSCGQQTDSIQLHIAPMPVQNNVSDYISMEAGTTTELNACATGFNYSWSGPAILENHETGIEINPEETAAYHCTVTTAFGCETTCSYVVDVRNYLLIPTGFSPNGDGVNDVFRILNKNIGLKQFTIYNRWGEVVFTTDDLLEGWDGLYKGMEQPLGVYVWTIDYTIKNKPQHAKGNVTLVR